MLCQICKKKEATKTFTKIVGGQKIEINLCKDCAALFSDKFTIFPLPQFDINDLLAGLLNAIDLYHKEEGIMVDKEIKCSNCQLTYNEFKRSGKLGCSVCYHDFRVQLTPLLRRLHGNSEHVGKTPRHSRGELNKIKKIKQLRKELQKMVLKEEYEKAAKMRDEILKLEGVIKKKNAK
ncbi:MAG: UvrB/UvrC motif-containing protein [Atribacterota bacterium]|nr:UvrB/UvrC motif-containing protein [Atribacterota bacterium]